MTVKWNADAHLSLVSEGIERGIIKSMALVQTEAARLMRSTPKTGRTYHRRGVTHVASAPGEPPAIDTGRLVNSSTMSYEASNLTGTIGWHTAYAAALEFGTLHMDPRPYARPALANMRDQINQTISDEVKAAVG